MKLVDEYYIIFNMRVNNAIYVQSKDNRKYLLFQRDPNFNLYYMDMKIEDHCYFNTVTKGKSMFSLLDQKRAEAVRIL